MMKKILPLILPFLPPLILANTPEQIARQQQMIQRQQDVQLQQEQQRLQQEEAARIQKSREGMQELKAPDKIIIDSAAREGVPNFEKIEVSGNILYSTEALNKIIIDKYTGKPINKNNISALQNDITALYIESGHSLARVYFDLHKTKITKEKSIFHLVIEEGVINKVKLEEEINGEKNNSPSTFKQFRLNMQKAFAFPSTEGDVFNLRDFEQGLDQINRLQSNNATMDIRPSTGDSLEGYSDIHIINKKESGRTTFFSTGIDNSSNKNTGETSANFSINQDNLFSVNDNLFLKYSHDITGRHDRSNETFYGNFSIPYGYWTANASLSYSEYLTTIEGMSTFIRTKGSTLTQNYTLDRVLYRSQFLKTNAGISLEVKDIENYVRDVRSDVGSRRSSNINLYINNVFYTTWGTIVLKPSYQHGLQWFDSKRDQPGLGKTDPRLQYDMLKFYAYYNTRFGVPWGEGKMNLDYTLTIDSQYAFSNLYGGDQFITGGEYTVRGFKDNNISGDIGFYVRNDLKANLRQLLPNFLINNSPVNYLSKELFQGTDLLENTYFSLFYDYGYVSHKYKFPDDRYNSNHGHMVGAGIALAYYGKSVNWSLTCAFPIHSPDYIQSRDGVKGTNHCIYWRMTVNF